jgi:MFS transporter, DHA3 family, macrolide efflux protein
MHFVSLRKNQVLKTWPFTLFLTFQSISGFGDAMRFIAVIALIVKISGSSLSAGLSLIFSVVPSVILSLLAGSFGDIVPSKSLLILIEILRSITALIFISADNLFVVYALLLALASLDAFSSPPLRKILVRILGGKELLQGNSILNGALGLFCILGSALAGIIIGFWGLAGVFLINSYCHAASALIISLIRAGKNTSKSEKMVIKPLRPLFANLSPVFDYFKSSRRIRGMVLANTIVGFCAISINIAFYPFIFDTLNLTEKEWGFLISIFYGANLIAMMIAVRLNRRFKNSGLIIVYIPLIFVALIWSLYSVVRSFPLILLLQLIEGISISLYNIFWVSKMQLSLKESVIGRVFGINDFINSLGKVAGICFAFTIIKATSLKQVFLLNSLLLFLYALHILFHEKVIIKKDHQTFL